MAFVEWTAVELGAGRWAMGTANWQLGTGNWEMACQRQMFYMRVVVPIVVVAAATMFCLAVA